MIENLEEEFREWMERNKYSMNTIKINYIPALKKSTSELQVEIKKTNIFEYITLEDFEKIYPSILSAPNLKEMSKSKGNGAYKAALKLYQKFLKERKEKYWLIHMLKEIENKIIEFIKKSAENDFENIYNEFSLQHELGIYLRNSLEKNYKVEFERNISFFIENVDKKEFTKKEIDITIYSEDKREKYAIELKHPLNGQVPLQMFSFVKDIKFLEELKNNGFNGGISFVLVKDKGFYEGRRQDEIYEFFRKEKELSGMVKKSTGGKIESVKLDGKYKIDWIEIGDYKYYILRL